MSTFNKFHSFVTGIAAGVFVGALNADSDTLKVYLSNTAPNAATHAVKADLAEITPGNGYPAEGFDTANAASTSVGVITVVGTDVTITATGGTIGPFRYAVLFDDDPTAPDDPLIGWWDYGSSITLAIGETFTTDFSASMFTVG
jgi:hypothetical protein